MSDQMANPFEVFIKERMQNLRVNRLTDPFNFRQGDFVTGSGCNNIAFFGLEMCQNQNALHVFDCFLKRLEVEQGPPARIIETGTGAGGLTIFLQLYCLTKGVQFTTYDDRRPDRDFHFRHQKLFDMLQIDFRQKSVADAAEEIKLEIVKPGVSVILCDADKFEEFRLFAPVLKAGDFILIHDYAPDELFFLTDMINKTWSFMQIRETDIAKLSEECHLGFIMKDEFQSAAWVCKRKIK